MSQRLLTEEKKHFIESHCNTMSFGEIAAAIDLTVNRVRYYIHRKKLHPATSVRYSDSEIDYIAHNFRIKSYKEIGQAIGRTTDSVRSKLKDLGMKRTRKDLTLLRDKYNSKTYFQKNHQPKNSLHDGAITKRLDSTGVPHLFIRISINKWIYLQVYNWTKLNGPIPDGMVLRCLNGITTDCRPENWTLITKNENLLRNSGREELTDKYIIDILSRDNKENVKVIAQIPELIEAKRQQLKLRRTINEQL